MPKEEAEGSTDNLIARDLLATDRTVLAIERTFLAFLRTSLTFLIAGISLIQLLPNSLWVIVGWCFVPVSIVTLIAGIHGRIKYAKIIKTILRSQKQESGRREAP